MHFRFFSLYPERSFLHFVSVQNASETARSMTTTTAVEAAAADTAMSPCV